MFDRAAGVWLAASLTLCMPTTAAADPFERCLAALRASRSARSIRAETWAQLRGAQPDTAVLAQLNAQPEFTLPVWDYVAVMADSDRVHDGVRLLAERRTIFDAIARRYGVDAEIVAAIWGIESNFGRGMGTFPVLRSLATLSCVGRRQSYFRGELLAALRIVQAGHIPADRFLGSWAGAFGQTQFMPGVFWWRAVDFDGDGHRDLIGNASDALASTANYLRGSGWRSGIPWGFEVALPATGPQTAAFTAGRRRTHSLAHWTSLGVTRVNGAPLAVTAADSALDAGLFLPAGIAGPRFLVTKNFSAVFAYNASESYALAIAHLSDLLRGGAAFSRAWPTDDPGLSRAERRELQQLLRTAGHADVVVDGLISPAMRAAVKVEQQRLGQAVTGRPGQRLLAAMRAR